MSDYRNPDLEPLDPNDPRRPDAGIGPADRPSNVVTGWVVAAVFVVAILAIIFGLSRQQQIGPTTASNDAVQRSASPTTTQTAPTTPSAHPNGPEPQSTPSPFATTKTPVNPMPPMPSQSSSGH